MEGAAESLALFDFGFSFGFDRGFMVGVKYATYI